MNYYDFIVPLLVIYGSCTVGIFVALATLHSASAKDPPRDAHATRDSVRDDASVRPDQSSPEPRAPPRDQSESGSESESEEKTRRVRRRPAVVNIQNEMEFFRELGKFFKQDNRLVFLLVVVLGAAATLLCYLYLHVAFSLAFGLGMVDFFFSLWFTRKVFIKSTLKLDLSSNATRVCHRNWRTFLGFIFACFVGSLSFTIMAVYSLLILYHYRLGPYLAELEAEGSFRGVRVLRSRSDAFVLLMAFYYVGKNLFHIFNNLWESFHMNNKIFDLLLFDQLRRKSLEFYSQGYYHNVTTRVHRQSIIFSEVLVVLTLGVFQISEALSVFFVYFYALLLWYLMVFGLTVLWMFNFRTSIEATRMTVVLKLGFLYYFITQFMFVYYRYFIAGRVVVVEAQGDATPASTAYAYTLMLIIFLMQKAQGYLFEPKEIKKLKALSQDHSAFEFFINEKLVFKLTVSLLVVYLVYLSLGFLGIFFMFFYFSVQRLFYRTKKYILVFDLYLRIMLWASRSAPIHSFTFNKLLELVDKTYLQNFFLLLFMIPLLCATRRRTPVPAGGSESYITYLYVSLLSFLASTLLLILYTKLVLQKHTQLLEARRAAVAGEDRAALREARGAALTRDKLFMLSCAAALTSLYVVAFYRFGSFYLALAIIIGSSIHLVQLIYTNKIRVKKFLNVKAHALADDAFIVKINAELAESTSYTKSVCELTFASFLVEVNKIMLLTFFFLNSLG